MEYEDKIKMFKDVFSPKSGEKVLFLADMPHDDIKDSDMWKNRRDMAREWHDIFKKMGDDVGFSVEIFEYPATGMHNGQIPDNVKETVKDYTLVIAMTEFSASSSLIPICMTKNSITRCASMPMVEKRMEETAFKADYQIVQQHATAIKEMLNNAVGTEITFSTGDLLHMDLRNRVAFADGGNCQNKGQFINFPSGEACKAPYEASPDEVSEFGESKTEGILPVDYEGELVKYVIKNNIIVEIIGDGKKAGEMQNFFEENNTRKNIAELGIGCNPNAVITGNVLEDEKVGLHIAYGMSSHLGGKVKSDMHQDICYSKGCPVEGITVTLINKDGSKTELIRDATLRYELLK